MRYLLAFWLLCLPAMALAGDITITIPNAFANSARATELCTFFASKFSVDSQPTRKVCLEEIVRIALIELAIEDVTRSIRESARSEAQTQESTIHGQWPTGLDLALCGDGELDTGEECDDAGTNSDTVADACRTDCLNAFCGDGVLDTGEVCDGTPFCAGDCLSVLPDPNNP